MFVFGVVEGGWICKWVDQIVGFGCEQRTTEQSCFLATFIKSKARSFEGRMSTNGKKSKFAKKKPKRKPQSKVAPSNQKLPPLKEKAGSYLNFTKPLSLLLKIYSTLELYEMFRYETEDWKIQKLFCDDGVCGLIDEATLSSVSLPVRKLITESSIFCAHLPVSNKRCPDNKEETKMM